MGGVGVNVPDEFTVSSFIYFLTSDLILFNICVILFPRPLILISTEKEFIAVPLLQGFKGETHQSLLKNCLLWY